MYISRSANASSLAPGREGSKAAGDEAWEPTIPELQPFFSWKTQVFRWVSMIFDAFWWFLMFFLYIKLFLMIFQWFSLSFRWEEGPRFWPRPSKQRQRMLKATDFRTALVCDLAHFWKVGRSCWTTPKWDLVDYVQTGSLGLKSGCGLVKQLAIIN